MKTNNTLYFSIIALATVQTLSAAQQTLDVRAANKYIANNTDISEIIPSSKNTEKKPKEEQIEVMKHPFIDNTLTPKWSLMTPAQVKTDIEYALAQAEEKLQLIRDQLPLSLNYQNTLLALEAASENLENAWGKVGHLDAVANSPELRKVYNEMLPKVSEYFTKIPLDAKLWEKIKAYSESPEARQLSGIRKRFLEEVLMDFKESGADLPPEGKKRLEAIETELAQITQKYSENVLDATNAWELIIKDESELAGLPESAKEAAKEDALQKNLGTPDKPQWRFTLQGPSMQPILQYLDNDSIREKVWRASNAVGDESPYDNSELINKILKLRQEKAQLLGYSNFADLILKRRMAKNGTKALNFVEELHDKIENIFQNELKSLEEYKAKATGTKVEKLQPWDLSYWAEKRRKALYDFDEEELSPYFPIESVIAGMFQITVKLFNIEIKEKKDVETWSNDVKYYEVYEKNGRLLGAFYADWYPRENKRSGAWMNHLVTGIQGEPHLGVICGNLTRPTKQKPALLKHRDVETIFHEFGHLLHHILGDVEVKSLHGTNVAWDFVELPSQLLENWCWERDSLDLFARHYLTGQPIPQELLNKMLAARTYLSAIDTMRQLSIAKMDLDLHMKYHDTSKNLDTFIDESLKNYLPEYKIKPKSLVRRFTHVFADPVGYAAAYYSYKWAEVLDADAFTRFKKEGILNPEVGLDFRSKILSKGNSSPAEELFRSFMGREPDIDALLERSGLKI